MFYINKATKEVATLVKIVADDGNSVIFDWDAKGTRKRSKIEKKNRQKKYIQGEKIILYMKQEEGVWKELSSCKYGDSLTFKNCTIFYGKPFCKENWIGFQLRNGDLAEVSEASTYKFGDDVIAVAKLTGKRLSSKGLTIKTYTSRFDCKATDVEIVKSKSTILTIGCYARHPIPSDTIFNVPKTELQKVLAWATYVADEWVPDPNLPELKIQKEAVAKELKKFRAKTS